MIQGYSTELTAENKAPAAPLVERVDASIGEASTMIGAMLTEFMRRTLRNGVIKIDEEMNDYVGEKVDATIADRTPLLEKTAAEVAEVTARAAAADLVTGEVQGLEHRTEAKARQLADRIQETERRAAQATTETAKRLASQIEETEKRVQSHSVETAQQLCGKLEVAEKQAAEKAQELTQQVEDLWTRSRRGVSYFKGRLKTAEAAVLQLDHAIKQEKAARQNEQAAIQTETLAQLESLKQRLQRQEHEAKTLLDQMRAELLQSHKESQTRLRDEAQQLRQANEALAARVAELERPRGIRALFGRVFGRGQQAQGAEAESETERPS